MNPNADIVQRILTRRLETRDVEEILDSLHLEDPSLCLASIADLLGRIASLLEVSNRLLDNLLQLIIEVATRAVGAERATLFLIDPETHELYSRVAKGEEVCEIRFPLDQGIAGTVIREQRPVIIADAYADLRFNREIDRQTGFKTRNLACVPIRLPAPKGSIGGLQVLTKIEGGFTSTDLELLEAICAQASGALKNAQDYELSQQARENESRLLEVTAAISSELQLKPLLEKVMEAITLILGADRATLFLHDEKRNELWSQVALGLDNQEIRIPCHLGIAGKVFSTGETINIADAYSDNRFNKEIDRRTGYRTSTILCMPVINRHGKTIGVTQVLNKHGGSFTRNDERKLRNFSAQAAIAIENAKLFDEVLNMKNANESILESLSNGVISLSSARKIEKCNAKALKTFGVAPEAIIGQYADLYFRGDNHWIVDSLRRVIATNDPDLFIDAEIVNTEGKRISLNMTIAPLRNAQNEAIGGLLVFEDLTSSKRLKSTLARYMTKEVADQLISSEETALGGQMKELTVLFSDIRSFTTISEKLGPQATVAMLNEYFTMMVDIVFHHGGILDKFIGDAMLAVFGAPFATGEDPDKAVTTAIEMYRALHPFNEQRTRKGLDRIGIGVGINTDEVLVGNIGSLKRMDYTVIGDGVNLASRLEGANKFYGTGILVSENTFRKLKGGYRSREVDRIRVKGKELPVRIYEILDHFDAASFPRLDEVLSCYSEGLDLYQKRRWAEAEKRFLAASRLHPGDRLSHVYAERCQHFLANPPTGDWDGVWVMKGK